jgi:hypothetical protein
MGTTAAAGALNPAPPVAAAGPAAAALALAAAVVASFKAVLKRPVTATRRCSDVGIRTAYTSRLASAPMGPPTFTGNWSGPDTWYQYEAGARSSKE